MFSSDDQIKLAAVLSKTFDPYTLAGQFNAVAKALKTDAPRSDHQDLLLKGYYNALCAVAERQYRQAHCAATHRSSLQSKSGDIKSVVIEGILRIVPSKEKFGKGGTPRPTVFIKTAQGDIQLYVVGAKPYDFEKRLDVLHAALKNKKVSTQGFLWGGEDGVKLMMAQAHHMSRWYPPSRDIPRKG